MANELSISYPSGSNTLYVLIRRTSDGKVWSVSSSTFVTWADGDLDNYDIVLTDQSGNLHMGDFPSTIVTGIEYQLQYYERAGASPALSDLLLNTEEGYWNGTVVSPSFTPAVSANSGASYCSVEDVRDLLPNNIDERISSPIPDFVTSEVSTTDIQDYIAKADRDLDAMLQQSYAVPLRRIKKINPNVVSSSGTISTYPDPIPFASARMAASYIYNERFTDDGGHIDGSRYGQQYMEEAKEKIRDIQTGTTLLPGQLFKGWRYLRPESKNSAEYPKEPRKIN